MKPVPEPSPGVHPGIELLAAYAEGAVPPADSERVREHLAACSACFLAFEELVRRRAQLLKDLDDPPVDPEWRMEARFVETRARSGVRGFRPGLVRARAGLVVAAVVAAILVVLPATQRNREWKRLVGPVRDAASAVSAVSGLRFPEVDGLGSSRGPTLRSGGLEVAALDESLQELHGRFEREPTARVTRWLATGLLAKGDYGGARAVLESARGRGVRDAPLVVVEGILAYQESRLEEAASRFREAAAMDPGLAEARENLTLVERERGR